MQAVKDPTNHMGKTYIRDIPEPWRTLESQFKSVEDKKLKNLTADLVVKTAIYLCAIKFLYPILASD